MASVSKIHKWSSAEPAFAKLSYNDMVTDVAGRALCEFVKGTPWRSVIYSVATEVCAWRHSQEDLKNA